MNVVCVCACVCVCVCVHACVCVCVCVHAHMCVYVFGGGMFDDKFVRVNSACFSLSMKCMHIGFS